MRRGSVKARPPGSTRPWFASQISGHSVGLPRSRPAIDQRVSPGWTSISSSPGEADTPRVAAEPPFAGEVVGEDEGSPVGGDSGAWGVGVAGALGTPGTSNSQP